MRQSTARSGGQPVVISARTPASACRPAKAIAAIAVLGDRLYVGSGFDYADGAELHVSDDGQTFDVAVSQEFFGRHENGQPISSSISGMFTSSIGGEDTLYVGTTGTDDYGARLLAITEDDISHVVDDSVDDDDTGLDEGGMSHGLHQVVSIESTGSKHVEPRCLYQRAPSPAQLFRRLQIRPFRCSAVVTRMTASSPSRSRSCCRYRLRGVTGVPVDS